MWAQNKIAKERYQCHLICFRGLIFDELIFDVCCIRKPQRRDVDGLLKGLRIFDLACFVLFSVPAETTPVKIIVLCRPTDPFLAEFQKLFWVTGSARSVHAQAHYGKSGQVVSILPLGQVVSVCSYGRHL